MDDVLVVIVTILLCFASFVLGATVSEAVTNNNCERYGQHVIEGKWRMTCERIVK